MAAPTPGTRVTPTAWEMDQGFRIQIVNSLNSSIAFWEVEVTPQGVDNGEPIQTANQFRQKWRTHRPRALNEHTGGHIKVAIAAGTKHEFEALVGKEATITEILPDGSTYCYYGYYRSIKFDAYKEGERPMADIEVVETDWDYNNSLEQDPVYTPAAGTAG